MKIASLPDDLPSVPPVIVSDPDGEKERAVAALALTGDCIGAARIALTIEHPIRRDLWLCQFRAATIAAALIDPRAPGREEGT